MIAIQKSRNRTSWVVLAGITAMSCGLLSAQQPITFRYFYDDLNQLVMAVDSTGVVIQYIYDSVGNILQINRSTVSSGALTIFNVTPQTVSAGAVVTIQGQGFSTTASLNIVKFGGVAATVVSATSTTLVVIVPSNAMSGPVSITVGNQTVTASSNETILPSAVSTGSFEVDTVPFSVLDSEATTAVPFEADSRPFSVLNSVSTVRASLESDTIPFSVCNNVSGMGCPGYSGLEPSLRQAKPTPQTVTGNRGGNGAMGAQAALAVVALAPADKAVEVSPRQPIGIVFSTPLDPVSINGSNFALSWEGKLLETKLSYSAEFRAVIVKAALPPDAAIRLEVSDQVQDLWGQRLQAFTSEFHTCGNCALPVPSVIAQRPGFGADHVSSEARISLSLASAIDSNLAQTALRVTEEGEPARGKVEVAQDGRSISFSSYEPFRAGGVVQVFLGEGYQGLFTIAPTAGESTEVSRIVFGRAIELEYNRPVDTSMADVVLRDPSSMPVPVRLGFRGDRVVRLAPLSPLSPDSTYTLEVGSFSRSFVPSAEHIEGLPRILSTEMDSTGEIHVNLDRQINPLTLDSDTVRLSQETAPISFSISLGDEGRQVILTPAAELKGRGGIQLSISGIEDLSGNIVPSADIVFQLPRVDVLPDRRGSGTEKVARRRNVRAGPRIFQFLIRRRSS